MTPMSPSQEAFCRRIEKARQSKKTWRKDTRIENVTPEKFVQCLRWSSWDVQHMGCGWYRLIDPSGKLTQIEMLSDRITWKADESASTACWHFTSCTLHLMPDNPKTTERRWDTTSLCAKGTGSVFIHFYSQI